MEQIQLSNSAHEGDNNVYLFNEGDEIALLDTGDWEQSTRDQLKAAFNKQNLSFTDVDYVFLTHWHQDHTGLAGEIQAVSGATVYSHYDDAPLIEGNRNAWEELQKRQDQFLSEWGTPENKKKALQKHVLNPDVTGKKPDVTPFVHGDDLSVGDCTLKVIHTPGHSAGHSAFEINVDGKREIFSGDALLPEYTPNVGGADIRLEHPLEEYLRTLQWVIDRNYDRAWPGHRNLIRDPTARAKNIIHHHEKRARRVLDTLAQREPCDVWTVSDQLFGELKGVHILHGPGESYAHLEHLARKGPVIQQGTKYRLDDGVAAKLDQQPAESWKIEY